MSENTPGSFSIIECLRQARQTGFSGRLSLDAAGANLARIYFERGHLVHAADAASQGDDVIYRLLGNNSVGAAWEVGEAGETASTSISRTDELLLLGALGLLTEEDVAGPRLPSRPGKAGGSAVGPAAATAVAQPAVNFEQLKARLVREVRVPPRFRRWGGLPLPLVRAYVLSLNMGQLSDIPELLAGARLSGFLTCAFSGVEAVCLYYRGKAYHCRLAEDSNLYRDELALRRLAEMSVPPDEPEAVLLYPLEDDFMHSYAALALGEIELGGLSVQSLKFNKFIAVLQQAGRTGALRLTSQRETGYIFLNNGRRLGGFIEVEGVLEENMLQFFQLATFPAGLIDVLVSPPPETL